MFEVYVRCPTTGEPVYAGFQSSPSGGAAPRIDMENLVCPACGARHQWEAAAVWSAIPVMLSPDEMPAFNLPTYEAPADGAPPLRAVWPRRVA